MADSFDRDVDTWLAEQRMEVLARASAIMMEGVLQATPKEVPGRMQATWIMAIEHVVDRFNDRGGVDARSLQFVASSHKADAAPEDDGSRASKYFDQSDVFNTNTSSTVMFQNALPFADEMEFGGTLVPGDEAGRKGGKKVKSFPGAFLSERREGSGGMVRWVDEGGVERQAPDRQLPGTNSIEKGFAAVKRNKKRLGLSFA